MTVIEERPTSLLRSKQEIELRVEPTDISFHDVPGNKVLIQVTVHNAGLDPSPATPMRLESAPLGAFVPWQPLAKLIVPALEPGESRQLSLEVPRPQPKPLGGFDRVPPKRLLTAVNAPDAASPQPDAGAGLMTLLGLMGKKTLTQDAKDLLAPDLMDMVGREQPHWAGNINVFVGNKAVERHLAKALRVYAGRTNMAIFMVGSFGKADAYSFELVGLAPDWNACLYDVTHQQSLVARSREIPLEETQWVESAGGLMVMLATRPPVGCDAGNLHVQVTKRSSGETATVEFNLDPTAQGAGCYFV